MNKIDYKIHNRLKIKHQIHFFITIKYKTYYLFILEKLMMITKLTIKALKMGFKREKNKNKKKQHKNC
jgi:hypothetical protein